MFHFINQAFFEMMGMLNNTYMANNRKNTPARQPQHPIHGAHAAQTQHPIHAAHAGQTQHVAHHAHNCVCHNCKNNKVKANVNTHPVNCVCQGCKNKTAPATGPKIPANRNATKPVTEPKKIKKEFVSKAKLLEPTIPQILVPMKKEDVRVGILVFAKYKGKYIQHKVAALDPKKGYKLTRKGHVNGWTKNVCNKLPNVKTETVTTVTTEPENKPEYEKGYMSDYY